MWTGVDAQTEEYRMKQGRHHCRVWLTGTGWQGSVLLAKHQKVGGHVFSVNAPTCQTCMDVIELWLKDYYAL